MPANQSTVDDDLYYMQTKGYLGDSLLWWRQGKHGYTPDIKHAHVWSKADAYRQHDAHLQHHVSSEHVSRRADGAT